MGKNHECIAHFLLVVLMRGAARGSTAGPGLRKKNCKLPTGYDFLEILYVWAKQLMQRGGRWQLTAHALCRAWLAPF